MNYSSGKTNKVNITLRIFMQTYADRNYSIVTISIHNSEEVILSQWNEEYSREMAAGVLKAALQIPCKHQSLI